MTRDDTAAAPRPKRISPGGPLQCHVYLGDGLYTAIENMRAEHGLTRSAAIRVLLRDGLLVHSQKNLATPDVVC
jgi:hypothetical protein